MAALDLHRGLERGACVWAGERLDLLDTFDSEMEEWEQQLQDVQKKIEELYKEVEARRGANEHAPVSGTSHAHLDFTLLPVDAANGCHGPSSCHGAGGKARSAHPCGERIGDALNYHGDYTDDTCGSEAGYHHNGVLCPKSQRVDGGRDATLDILSGYLRGEESEHSPRSPACPHMVPTRTQSAHINQDSSKLGPVFGRTGECAEVVGKRNRVLGQDGAPHVSWRDAPSSTQTSQKPVGKPLRQRDVATPLPTHTRSCHVAESPQQPDRKCSLLDRKCGSPSVLRKFGAMLQENEGKTLVQDGTVTTVISADPSKAPATPVCQRKLGGGRASTHTPVQKCPQDPEVRPAGVDARPLPRRPPTGPGSRMRGPQGLEDRDRTLGVCGPQYQGRGGDHTHGQDSQGLRDTVKWEEQDTAGYRVQQTSYQPSSPVPGRRNFSRPARPANQRPPARWANHAPTAKIVPPSGPMSLPPSLGRNAKQSFSNFSLYTETVIM